MDLGIKGKTAIVTGAASKKGIGHAVTMALVAEGVKVVVTDIIEEGVKELAKEINDGGGEALAIKNDQSDFDQVKDAVAQTVEHFGGVDILVNCAAVTTNFGTISRMKPEKWEFEIGVNLNGPFYWTNQCLPLMKKNNWGRIVNVSSVAGLFGTTGIPCYAVAKGGLHTLTKQTARENAGAGITANCVVLGIIATEIYERGIIDAKTVERLISNIPLGRMGLPSEIADTVTFLCSAKASYQTGSLITMDGALSISI